MNKEEIYDAQIEPLMKQILGICENNGIAMVASYSIPTEADKSLCCTSHLPDGEGKYYRYYAAFIATVNHGPRSRPFAN